MRIARKRGKGMDLTVANAIADPFAWEQLKKMKDLPPDIDLGKMK